MSFEYEKVLCPECNSEMVSRTGKYGMFWGCPSYPRCAGTRDAEGRSKKDREEWKAKQKPGYESSVDDSLTSETSDSKSSFKKN